MRRTRGPHIHKRRRADSRPNSHGWTHMNAHECVCEWMHLHALECVRMRVRQNATCDRMHLMCGCIQMHLNATHVECNTAGMHNNANECTPSWMLYDAASTNASKCITMHHATNASHGECINMKRTFWMHQNALKCNMSRMQQVIECIKMQPPHVGRMQQLQVVLKCVRM